MRTGFEKQKITDLRIRTEFCRTELAQILSSWFYLKNIIYPQLEYSYFSLFGEIENEINNRTDYLKSLKIKRNKYYQIYNQTTETKNDNINNLKQSADNLFKKIESGFDSELIPQLPLNVEYEVSTLYRKIVKKIHPDVNPTDDIHKKYWINVQDAYQNRNVNKLRLYHKILCHEDYLEIINKRHLERVLQQELNELENNIKTEKKKIQHLMMQEPFIFKDKINDERWIAHRKKLLELRLERLNEKIKVFESC